MRGCFLFVFCYKNSIFCRKKSGEYDILVLMIIEGETMDNISLEESKKYLPIGSVVLLKNGIAMYMIAGYMHENDDGKINEYVSIPYPYGLMALEALYFFNHEDIDTVISLGYKDKDYEIINQMLLNYKK